jgi:hypothetical protein
MLPDMVTPVLWILFQFGTVKFKLTSDVILCIITDPKITTRGVVVPTLLPQTPATIHPLNHLKMARNLNPGQRKMVVHMINSKKRLTTSQMAKLAKCTERPITNIRKKMRLFGSPNPPKIPPGPPPIVTSVMLEPFVTTSLRYPAFISKRWLSSYGTSSTYYHHHPASNVLFLGLDGPRRQPGRNPKSRILNYEISTNTNYLSSIHTTLFSLMNPDVING